MKPREVKKEALRPAPADGSILTFDLSGCSGITTVEFARLVLLRRELMAQGRDLRVAGLSGRARILYEICHLQAAFPQCESTLDTG